MKNKISPTKKKEVNEDTNRKELVHIGNNEEIYSKRLLIKIMISKTVQED